MLALVMASLIVVILAVYAPAARTGVFRTDAVLRAMGVPAEPGSPSVASAEPVPSLSVIPRFVLPLVRDERKRLLAVAPAPLPTTVTAALPVPMPMPLPLPLPVPYRPAEPVVAAEVAPPPADIVPPPPAVVAKPRPPVAPLTTAVLITPTPPRHAQAMPVGQPMLALVIDDLGPSVSLTRRAMRLPRPVTLAFLPYASDLDDLTAAGRAQGHEIYLHLPMEPIGNADPGPNAIQVGLDPAEFQRRLSWAFDRVPLAAGVNNHMGSRATSDPASMLKVLQEARRRGLSFVDSRTSPLSVGDGLAEQLGVPHAARDVFLDNVPTMGAVLRQLAEAEHLARRRGQALAIGHPYSATLAALEAWIPAAEARGLRIVRAGDLIARSRCGQPQALTVSACMGSGCPPAPAC